MNIKLKSRRINDNIIQYYKIYATNNGDEYNSIEEYNKHSMDYKSLKDYNINESYKTFLLDLSEYLGDYFTVEQFDILNGSISDGRRQRGSSRRRQDYSRNCQGKS